MHHVYNTVLDQKDKYRIQIARKSIFDENDKIKEAVYDKYEDVLDFNEENIKGNKKRSLIFMKLKPMMKRSSHSILKNLKK